MANRDFVEQRGGKSMGDVILVSDDDCDWYFAEGPALEIEPLLCIGDFNLELRRRR